MTFTEQMQAVLESYIENQAGPALSTTSSSESSESLPTAFGEIEIDKAKFISFEDGLPGLEEATEFALATLPDENLKMYLMLQSLQVPDLTLVTIPLDPQINLVSETDLTEAAESLPTTLNDALFLFLVSVHPQENEAALVTVNLRAPLVIDVNTRKGKQHILSNGQLEIQYPISGN